MDTLTYRCSAFEPVGWSIVYSLRNTIVKRYTECIDSLVVSLCLSVALVLRQNAPTQPGRQRVGLWQW